jgi:N-acetyl-gamma-glutamyl-phosphate reductase
MQQRCGLSVPPLFTPAVIPAHRGMVVEVPLPLSSIQEAGTPDAMREALAEFYAGSPIVRMGAAPEEGEMLLRTSDAGSDRLELFVFGSADGSQARLVAVLDNLGKGASGAAIQSLNLMAGLDETAGLRL